MFFLDRATFCSASANSAATAPARNSSPSSGPKPNPNPNHNAVPNLERAWLVYRGIVILENSLVVVRAHFTRKLPCTGRSIYAKSSTRGLIMYPEGSVERSVRGAPPERAKELRRSHFWTLGRFGRTNTPTRDTETSYRTMMRVLAFDGTSFF